MAFRSKQTADQTKYDNQVSGLNADNVRTAIDELAPGGTAAAGTVILNVTCDSGVATWIFYSV